MDTTKPTGLALLREPFPPHQISKLPKESKAQIEERKNNRNTAMVCDLCGSWHHKNAVHLDYVGHAALTDRLLDADPNWSWTPIAHDEHGLPWFDREGGLWIRLTVCGVTRLGYGHADGKTGGNAIKEAIGDALRNAAMRFGAALDLWHKGDLRGEDDTDPKKGASPKKDPLPKKDPPPSMSEAEAQKHLLAIQNAADGNALAKVFAVAWEAAKSAKDKPTAEKFKAAYQDAKAKFTTRNAA